MSYTKSIYLGLMPMMALPTLLWRFLIRPILAIGTGLVVLTFVIITLPIAGLMGMLNEQNTKLMVDFIRNE